MSLVRIGFIGTSRSLQLARACARVPEIEASIFFDVNAEAAESAAMEVGADVAPTLEALLESEVDAIVVGSPIPLHLEHVTAIAKAGKHVLSEVTPCSTLSEARELVDVVSRAGVTYMLAENFCYFSEVETVGRLHHEGKFGDVYFAESDHVGDLSTLWRTDDGDLTWRGQGGVGVYSTHSLGPLLTILGDRAATVSAVTVPGGKFDPEVTQPTMHLIQLTTIGGVQVRLRIDLASPRPGLGAYYGIQGTRGSYESWRGLGDECKVWLDDEHGRSGFRKRGAWHPLDCFRERYLGDQWEAVPGTEGADHRMMADFAAVLRGERANPIDVYRALDFYLPGLLADESALNGSVPLPVPDPRGWADSD